MKKIETWLNEKEYKKFIKACERAKKTPYSFLKSLVLRELDKDTQAIVETVHFSRNSK